MTDARSDATTSATNAATSDVPDDAIAGTAAPAMGYADALQELEEILGELEDDSMDIDVLSDRVERAAILIKACRSRINLAQDRVAEIVAELDDLATPPD